MRYSRLDRPHIDTSTRFASRLCMQLARDTIVSLSTFIQLDATRCVDTYRMNILARLFTKCDTNAATVHRHRYPVAVGTSLLLVQLVWPILSYTVFRYSHSTGFKSSSSARRNRFIIFFIRDIFFAHEKKTIRCNIKIFCNRLKRMWEMYLLIKSAALRIFDFYTNLKLRFNKILMRRLLFGLVTFNVYVLIISC